MRDDEFDPHKEGKFLYTHLPLGAKLGISEAYFTSGGNATNVAVTIARQGLNSRYLWVLGSEDPVSRTVLDELDNESVDTRFVQQQKDIKAGFSTVLLATTGERTILSYAGTIPRTKDILANLDVFEGVNWVYPSSLGDYDTLDRVVKEAKKRGSKVMFNPATSELSDIKRLKAVLHDVDVLCMNKEEMQLIVEGNTTETLVRHALNYCPVVIVSDGPNGVCASDGKTIVTAGMYEDVPVYDRTGAGDAFASGFLSQWAQGASLRDAIVFASANSTSVVTQIGAKPGILHENAQLHDMPLKEKEI